MTEYFYVDPERLWYEKLPSKLEHSTRRAVVKVKDECR